MGLGTVLMIIAWESGYHVFDIQMPLARVITCYFIMLVLFELIALNKSCNANEVWS